LLHRINTSWVERLTLDSRRLDKVVGMAIPSQKPVLPPSYLGVLQNRPAPARADQPAANPNLRERPIAAGTPVSGTTPVRGSLVNILV
jgi:hypothetical protein